MNYTNLISNVIGEGNLGRLEYFLKPNLKNTGGGPFNGQKYRQRIFQNIIDRFPIKAIIETGTFRGTTTAFFAETSLPVYTVESHPRFFAYAKMRFRQNSNNIHLYKGDSRIFLKQLVQKNSFPKTDILFYLDAHWERDLPLQQELEIIFSHWERSIILIDDFQVPNSDYGFDDYGPGKALTLNYLQPLTKFNFSVFFPAVEASQETGARQGCVVLCQETSLVNTLEELKTLTKGSLPQ